MLIVPPDGGNQIAATGTWSFTLSGTPTSNGVFHAWCSTGCTFPNGDTDYTIGEPAVAANAITVGAIRNKGCWTNAQGSTPCYEFPTDPAGIISGFSSKGPTRDERIKPDIVAPGEGIGSALSSDGSANSSIILPGSTHFINQGTSMASPHVAGAVALYLAENPSLDAATILQTLKDSAIADAQTGTVPNNSAGYGKMNIAPLGVVLPTLGISDLSVGEGVGDATLTVSLSPAAGQTVTVGYGTADDTAASGEDYIPTGGTVTFQAGETSKTVTVAIINDSDIESDETFEVELSSPTGGAQISTANDIATVTIQDNDLAVTKTADTNGTCTPGDCSLREAIAAATTGATIVVPAGTYTLDFGQQLFINESLTLFGAGANDTIIQANVSRNTANFEVINIQSGTVTISGVTVRHGKAASGGGIVILTEDSVTISNSTISDNDADAGGGILTNLNAKLTIMDSTIIGNLAGSSAGGGIYLNTASTLSITGSTITGNSAAQGGGIFNGGTSATITNSALNNNSATGANTGGGAVLNNTGSQLTITDSTLTGNMAPAGIGGVLLNSGDAAITNSTLGNNTSGSSGGAIYTASGSQVTITNSALSSNSSSASSGGAISADPGAVVTVTESTLSGNTANGSGQVGGAIFNNGTVTLLRSTLSGNSAGSIGGGAVYNNGAILNVTNSTLSGNSTTGQGGAITNFSGTVTILNSTITANSADGNFGGILSFDQGAGSSTTLKNTLLSNSNGDCNFGGTSSSLGHNIDTDFSCGLNQFGDHGGTANLKIGPLQDNGGPTFTHELLSGSVAIDAGDDTAAPSTDQRGFERDGTSDIGSFESAGALPSHALTVSKSGTGTGTVTSAPVGIDCGGDCSEPFVQGTQVTLTATPDTDILFAAWIGCDTVNGDQCVVTINAPTTVEAVFNEKDPPPLYLDQWGAQGDGNGQFESPTGIAIDSSGIVYIVDSGNDRIQKFDSSGNFFDSFGSGGTSPGEFHTPSGIVIDGSDNIFVSDEGLHRVQKFDTSGNVLGQWGTFGSGQAADDGDFNAPRGLAVDGSGNVYVADSKNHRVQKFDNAGNFLAKWGSFTNSEMLEDGKFNEPSGIAIDGSGNIFVTEKFNDRVQVFASGMNFVRKWGTVGSGDTQLFRPSDIAVDSAGNVYVADTNNHRIQKFEPTGGAINNWGGQGTGEGQFNMPQGVAVGPSGDVFASDTNNHRIQKFVPSPIVVNTTDDELNTDGDCSLREAIQAANTDTAVSGCPAGTGGDTIVLQENATYLLTISGANEDANQTGDLDITSDVAIEGNGATIDGGYRPVGQAADGFGDRVLGVQNGATFNVRNITVTGGSSDFGGGILNVGGTLTVIDSTVVANTASSHGGGIESNGTLTLTNSAVRLNNAGDSGGGIWSSGALMLSNSIVSDNTAGRSGGGLRNFSGSVDITNTNVSSNTSDSAGGILNTSGTMSLMNSSVTGNTASVNSAGGIYNRDTLSLIDSMVAGNSSGSSGSGIVNEGGIVTLISSTVSDNSVDNGSGGGIFNGGIFKDGGIVRGTTILTNSTVTANSSTIVGGGILNVDGTLTLTNATIAGNSAGNGGGLYSEPSGTISLSNTMIAQNLDGKDCVVNSPVVSLGHNLDSDGSCNLNGTGDLSNVDPKLGPLTDNGGPTLTHALLIGSPAIDAGDPGTPGSGGTACEATDQRGIARPQRTRCDIGAFELEPLPTISIAGVTVGESVGDAQLSITLSETFTRDVVVEYSTTDGTAHASADYTPTTATATVLAGSISSVATIPIADDVVDEPDDTFTVALSNPISAELDTGASTAVVTIQDDDPQPTASIGDVSVNEGSGTLAFPLALNVASGFDVTVDFTISDGNAASPDDYSYVGTQGNDATDSLTIAAGSNTGEIVINIVDDVLNENDEQFTISISNPINAEIGNNFAVVTIEDNDPEPNIVAGDLTVDEGDGDIAFPVTLDAPSSFNVTFDYALTDGTATDSGDYRPPVVLAFGDTVTILAGATTGDITVSIVDDALDEPDESFIVTLSNPAKGLLPQESEASTVTIQDNDPTPTVSISDAVVNEGVGTVELIVSIDALSGRNVTVDYVAFDGSALAGLDFINVSSAASIATGTTSTTVSVTIVDDNIFELDETLSIDLLNPTNATLAGGGGSVGTVTIQDDDVAPTISIQETAAITEGDGSAQTQVDIEVVLTNVLYTDVTVEFATSDGTATAGQDYVGATNSVTIAANTTSTTIQVTVEGDDSDENDETFVVTISNSTSAVGSLTITRGTSTVSILDDDGAIVAETALQPTLDVDDVAFAELRVERLKYDGGELTFGSANGFQSFDATLTFDINAVEILDVREVAEFAGNTNFDSTSVPGQLTISGSIAGAPADIGPLVLAKIVVRLTGSSETDTQLTVTSLQVTEATSGTAFNQQEQVSNTYRRGDVRADGQVKATDRLFLTQCLLGLRDYGTAVTECHPINAASIEHDDPIGDMPTETDGLYISQLVVELRDASFNLIP